MSMRRAVSDRRTYFRVGLASSPRLSSSSRVRWPAQAKPLQSKAGYPGQDGVPAIAPINFYPTSTPIKHAIVIIAKTVVSTTSSPPINPSPGKAWTIFFQNTFLIPMALQDPIILLQFSTPHAIQGPV